MRIFFNLSTILLVVCLLGYTTAQEDITEFPFDLDEEEANKLFMVFLWAMDKADKTERNVNTNSFEYPFKIKSEEVGRIYSNFLTGLRMTGLGLELKIPNLTLTFGSKKDSEDSYGDTYEEEEEVEKPPFLGPTEEIKEMSFAIFKRLNEYRVENDLSILQWSDKVYDIATEHNDYMKVQGEISHDLFKERFEGFRFANENVAFYGGYDVNTEEGADLFMVMWKNSPEHDVNMKANEPTHGAVSVLFDVNRQRYYSCMNLAIP